MQFFSRIKAKARRASLKVQQLDDRIVPAVDMLPDLTVWADQGRGYMYDWYLDTTTQPGHTLLRLSTVVPNIGAGPLEIRDVPHEHDGVLEHHVYQRIYDDAGGYTERESGAFVFHEGHGHIHFDAFAQNSLRAVTAGDGVGAVVASGLKTSFLLEDSTIYNAALPGHPSTRGYYRQGTIQGISVGWADVYNRNLPDQWIDVTNIPAGTYWLETAVDPDNNITESNETNNVTRIKVTIGGVGGNAPDYAGNTMSAARPLGALTTNQSFSDFVSPADTNDYYRFSLDSTANFSLRMDGLTADADVQLLSSAGAVLARSIASGRNAEAINQSLAAGTYYVRIYPYGSANTSYNLNMAGGSTNADGAGNTIETARDLGDVQVAQTVGDLVSTADRDDFYRFRATGTTDLAFTLSLNRLTGDAGVQLIDESGVVVATSTNTGTSNESIQYTLHHGDAYFIRVYLQNGEQASYSLSTSATVPGGTDGAGDTTAAARDIGTLSTSQSFQDQIGGLDLNDYYRLILSGQSTLSLRLDNLVADADVQVISSSGAIVARSRNSGTTAETISQVLAAGTYYVRIYPYSNGVTSYNLSLSSTPVTTTDGAGNTLATARDIGQLSAPLTINDAIGNGDSTDYYRFNLTSQRTVTLRMDQLAADADLYLYDSGGRIVARSTGTGISAENISQLLAAGTYYIRVYPYASASTNYRLAVGLA